MFVDASSFDIGTGGIMHFASSFAKPPSNVYIGVNFNGILRKRSGIRKMRRGVIDFWDAATPASRIIVCPANANPSASIKSWIHTA